MVGNGLGTAPNGIVNIWDIFAIKQTALFRTGSYAAGDEVVYNAVPEPSTLVMLAMGLLGILVWRCRRTYGSPA